MLVHRMKNALSISDVLLLANMFLSNFFFQNFVYIRTVIRIAMIPIMVHACLEILDHVSSM